MKKTFLLSGLLFILSLPILLAQTSMDDEITLIQASFGMDKKQIIDGYMNLPESVSPAFWTIYSAYEENRKELARERLTIINDFLE